MSKLHEAKNKLREQLNRFSSREEKTDFLWDFLSTHAWNRYLDTGNTICPSDHQSDWEAATWAAAMTLLYELGQAELNNPSPTTSS
jgi:hypothetical protein